MKNGRRGKFGVPRPSIDKKDIVKALSEGTGITRGDARAIYQFFVSMIDECVDNAIEMNFAPIGKIEYQVIPEHDSPALFNIHVPTQLKPVFKFHNSYKRDVKERTAELAEQLLKDKEEEERKKNK